MKYKVYDFMKTKNVVLGFLLVFMLLPLAAQDFSGQGTKAAPYLIQTESDLLLLSAKVAIGERFEDKWFLQTVDIAMTTANFRSIGEFGTDKAFCGVYDGNGHVIKNLQLHIAAEDLSNPQKSNVALFAWLGGTVMNLGIESGFIEGACCGSIASHAYGSDAKIVNCYNKATVKGYRAGGIADNFNGLIAGCWTDCQLEGDMIGGIFSYYAKECYYCYTKETPDFKISFGVDIFSDELELQQNMNTNLFAVAKFVDVKLTDLKKWNISNDVVTFQVSAPFRERHRIIIIILVVLILFCSIVILLYIKKLHNTTSRGELSKIELINNQTQNITEQESLRLFFALFLLILYVASLLIFFSYTEDTLTFAASLTSIKVGTVIKFFVKLSVATAGYFLLLFLMRKVCKMQAIAGEKSKLHFSYVLICFVYFVSFALLQLKSWAVYRFPLDAPDLVWFTISNINGAVDKTFYKQAFGLITFSFFASLILFFCVYRLHKKFKVKSFNSVLGKNVSVKLIYTVFVLACFVFALFITIKDIHLLEYPAIIERTKNVAYESNFYNTEYITPKYENIIFPEKKRNLIFIFMESMESSYADRASGGLMEKNLIPNLTKMCLEDKDVVAFSNTDKLGGGIDILGTNWTFAAMLADFFALPFHPMLGIKNNNVRTELLPNAVSITDVLTHNGYTQIFSCGSDKHFASRDILLETHGNVKVHDIAWYKEHGMLDPDYEVFWGFEDRKLYKFAQYELGELSKDKKSFAYFLLTVDTHYPTGYQDDMMPTTEDMPIKNTILDADTQIADFIAWCKTQSWYENTTIAIVGDHMFMETGATSPFDKNADLSQRRWITLFINSRFLTQTSNIDIILPQQDRQFSSLDLFPTTLSAMGCKIKDNRLGFGVDLSSGEKTLCERYPLEIVNRGIMENSTMYHYFQYW